MVGMTTPPVTADHADVVEPLRPRRRRHRRRLVGAVVVVVVLVGGGAYVQWRNPYGVSVSHPLGIDHDRAASGSHDDHAATSTAVVTRRSLSSQTSVSGSLGFAGSYTVLGQGHGTVTWLPQVGQVIHQGQVLYRADGNPVVLLYGSTPAYRPISDGDSGADVRQLNAALVALHFVRTAEVSPYSHRFGSATTTGLQRLQHSLGLSGTGKLALGDVVFEPGPVRVTAVSAKLGGPVGGAVFTATSLTRQVTVNLDASEQSEVRVGDRVSITLPNNRTTPGTVASVGTVATAPSSSGSGSGSGDSTPTIPVHITPTDPAATGTLDQAPVQVAITTASVSNVLVVPVYALLALSSGGYAVEVVGGDGSHHLQAVSLGLFDDAAGLVQVTGSGLSSGQRVVVPAS